MKAGLLGCDSISNTSCVRSSFISYMSSSQMCIWLALTTVGERACLLLSLSRHYSSLIKSRACPPQSLQKSTAPWLPIAGGHPTQALYWLLLTSEQISWEFHLWEKNILNKERHFLENAILVFYFSLFLYDFLSFLNFISFLATCQHISPSSFYF